MAGNVLLTGANGFLGAHILSQLLSSNFTVRAIVRSQTKADQVRSDHPTAGPQLDFGIVPDITAPGAFNQVFKYDPPIDLVIHTASPFNYKVVTNNLKDVMIPAKQGTEEILRAIKAHAPSVKRVVITSSIAAVLDFDAGNNGRRYTADDWNPATWEQGVEGNTGVGYRASKKYAEKAAWEFLQREKPAFDLVTLCPPMIYGPLAHSIASPKDLNQSNARIYDSFITSSRNAELPPNALYLYVDVRDTATAHILAAASNKRFIIAKSQIGSQQIADILRRNIPELETRTPEGSPGTNSLPANAYSVDSSPAEEVLGVKFRSAEGTFVDLGRGLLGVEGGGA